MISSTKPLHLPLDRAPVLLGTSQRSLDLQSLHNCTRSSNTPLWHRIQATLPHTLSRQRTWPLSYQKGTCLYSPVAVAAASKPAQDQSKLRVSRPDNFKVLAQ
eukprot:6244-Heterococcus_DN1.PRE.1